jgi:uncharacterized protein (TIGR00251 family)
MQSFLIKAFGLPIGSSPDIVCAELHLSELILMSRPAFLRVQADGILLSIKLQPRASANEIGDPLGNELRMKVTAPPVDAAANEALVRLVAEALDCPRNRIELVRGQTSRHKVVKVSGLSEEVVTARLIGGRP